MIKKTLRGEIEKAIESAGYMVPIDFSFEKPPQKEMGDYATNVPLIITAAKKELIAREVAEKIKSELKKSEIIKNIEIAGAGFINIFITNSVYLDQIKQILEQAENYGKIDLGQGRKVNVEYISANPTGPLHIGNARGGPIGEAIANLYENFGYEVIREFYVNDVGGQINHLAESLLYYYEVKHDQRIIFPEGGYPGDYIEEISEEIQKEFADELEKIEEHSKLLELFGREGLKILIRNIKEASELIGITFDNWAFESELQRSGKTAAAIQQLQEKDFVVSREGALWFKRENDLEFSDKESVLERSDQNRTPTYFADDIAYHKDKFDRGAEVLVDVWGANHHGHIDRLKSAVEALGYNIDNFHIILYQYVRLKNAGEILKMSKREGNFITLKQVIESGVAPDAFKYFILAQNPNTPFDFDIKLAADTSEKNPVYYIEYAHARICSILAKAAGESGVTEIKSANLELLKEKEELDLARGLVEYPDILLEVKENYQLQLLPHYIYKIASLFHSFYTNCQVLSDDLELTKARLALITAAKYVIANALKILDIEALEKM
jgi:arginyl-tRNA synthetase